MGCVRDADHLDEPVDQELLCLVVNVRALLCQRPKEHPQEHERDEDRVKYCGHQCENVHLHAPAAT